MNENNSFFLQTAFFVALLEKKPTIFFRIRLTVFRESLCNCITTTFVILEVLSLKISPIPVKFLL